MVGVRYGGQIHYHYTPEPLSGSIYYDAFLVVCALCGVLLFIFAGKLCRSISFYYVTGISLGVLTSILIIFIIFGRLFTKNLSVIVISGSLLTLGFMKWLSLNLQMAHEFYHEYLIGYLVGSALLSFAVCYYFLPMMTPITNQRLLDLIKWFLQGIAFVMIYFGIHSTVFSYSVIGLLLGSQVITSYWRRS